MTIRTRLAQAFAILGTIVAAVFFQTAHTLDPEWVEEMGARYPEAMTESGCETCTNCGQELPQN